MKKSIVPVLPIVLLTLGACASGPDKDVLLLHAAFGTTKAVVFEGRVMDGADATDFDPADDAATNLRRNVALFTADECDACPVRLAFANTLPIDTETDGEGFFRVEMSEVDLEPAGSEVLGTGGGAGPLKSGWRSFRARSGGGARVGEALIVPAGNRLGIVSDVDDTILVTEVGDRFRMLGNTFLKNPAQRDAVPGTADLYARTLAVNPDPASAPLFYLSSSPRQLQTYLTGFLERNGYPRGVLFTRRLSLDREGYERLDSHAYKTARIEELLERLPDVTFVLVGDDGEHDPAVYQEIRQRHPTRIAAVWIRRANPDAPATLPTGQVALAEVLAGRVALPELPLDQ